MVMIEERWEMYMGRRAFSTRIAKRIIIINNRLERQRENLKKKEYTGRFRYLAPGQKKLFECKNQK